MTGWLRHGQSVRSRFENVVLLLHDFDEVDRLTFFDEASFIKCRFVSEAAGGGARLRVTVVPIVGGVDRDLVAATKRRAWHEAQGPLIILSMIGLKREGRAVIAQDAVNILQ